MQTLPFYHLQVIKCEVENIQRSYSVTIMIYFTVILKGKLSAANKTSGKLQQRYVHLC